MDEDETWRIWRRQMMDILLGLVVLIGVLYGLDYVWSFLQVIVP